VSEVAGIQEPSPEEPTVEDTSPGGVNYHDRIRVEPDFAVDEIKNKDRYIGELHEKAVRFKSLEQYVDAVGGDELARLAGIGNQIETNPQLKQVLQDALNGVVQKTPVIEEEEEIFDPEIKAIRNRYDSELDEQKLVIRDLQSRLNQTEAISLTGSLTENMEAALSTFSDDPESLEAAQIELKQAVSQLETAAKNGNRSAASQMQDLGGDKGTKTMEMMTIDIYKKYVAKKLELASNQPNGEIMLSKATDAKSTTRSPLPSDTIAIKPGRVTSELVDQVMQKVARKMGKDPATLFNH
jgi:hypothetical protein